MDKTQTTTSPAENKKLGLTDEVAHAIGTRLQEAREKKSKTYKQIAAKVRVKESYLEAIELGNWDLLPVGVNGRGFIRLYARELDVSLPEFDEFSQAKSQYQVLAEDYDKVVAVKSKKEAKKSLKKTAAAKSKVDDSSEPKLIIDDLNSKVSLIGQSAAERGSIIEELNEELNGHEDDKNAESEEVRNLKTKIRAHSKKIFLFSLSVCFLYGVFVFFNDDGTLHMVSQSFLNMKAKITSVFEKNDVIVAVPEQPLAPTTESLNQVATTAPEQQQAQPQVQAQVQEQQQAQPQVQAQVQEQAQAQPQVQAQVQEQAQVQPQVQAQVQEQAQAQPQVQPQTQIQTQEQAQAQTPPPSPTPIAAVERIAKVDILSPVEIKIRADGKNIFSGIHEAGALELSFTQNAEISVVDGSKMKLSYGGWDLGVLGTPGRKRKIILNAQSYQETP